MDDNLIEEAKAFNDRINVRVKNGFIPDLQNAKFCDYFYKSMFRDPHFMKLYFNKGIEFYATQIRNHFGDRAVSILDVGCGPGIVTLELARLGHNVIGTDIAADAVKSAQQTAEHYFKSDNNGTLDYQVIPFMEITGTFDVVLFSGVLHHLDNLQESILKTNSLLNKGGLILCQEPYHLKFDKKDAALVALFRTLLATTGHWYEEELSAIQTPIQLDTLADDILTEFRLERDKHETDGQSPNDLTHDGGEILEELQQHFNEISTIPYYSFIYRFLGGLRGDIEKTHEIANLLTMFDSYATANGIMNANYYLFCGSKK